MPDICAAIGLSQLRKYDAHILSRRREIYEYYCDRLSRYDWTILPPRDDIESTSSYHIYALRIQDICEGERDRIIDYMAERGISVNVHFVPLPMLTLFKNMGYEISEFPVAYQNYSTEISLPIYPQLTFEQLDSITSVLAAAYEKCLTYDKAF
jgi:dTDP-4-amino-4,6-dideoxygalactose transaminase